jgi:hypothetical protein
MPCRRFPGKRQHVSQGRWERFCALGAGIFMEMRLHWNRDEFSGKTGNLPVNQGCIDRDTSLMPEYPVTQSSSRMGIAFPFRYYSQDLFLHPFPGFSPLLPTGQKFSVPGLSVPNMSCNGQPYRLLIKTLS